MKHNVFISYASQDRKFAQQLKSRLAQILPSKPLEIVILDPQSDVSVGTDIRKTINDAMNAASTVVIVSSPHADHSEWVSYEAGLADALEKDVVIVGRKGTGKSALLNRLDSARFIEVDDKA
jgi:putative ribosome biogenesis GTPase RsgA